MTAVPTYPHDLFTDEVLAHPYEHYRALRDLGPIVWLEAHEMYALPGYTEARAALSDADTYCSGQGVALNDTTNSLMAGSSTLMTDGELHDHLRTVLAENLTPRSLRSAREGVTQLAADLVEGLVAKGSFDAVSDLARALPLSVVPDLVGWPLDGRDHLLEWASATFDFLGPMNQRAEDAVPTVREMFRFANDTAATGNLLPGSVGAGVIEAARQGDLEPERVPALIVGYLAPSLDTTISAIGSAAWLLATHPDQWDVLKADPSLIPNAFNETVRLESPLRAFSRVTTATTEIGEFEIAAGARLMILYASANRDDRHFAQADQFDVSRTNATEHLGFGYGVHGCAGQGLARMEVHAVLGALLEQVDHIELSGTPERSLNNLINAWSTLPVSVRPART
jgi:cytochrome P450